MVSNKSLIFAKIPTHAPVPGEHLKLENRDFDLTSFPPPQNGITAKTLYVSLDPFMRGRMRPSTTKSYSAAYTIGDAIIGYALVQVIQSANDKYKPGDIVYGQFPVSEYSINPHEALDRALVRKVHPLENAPLSNWLSILGSTGLTAYSSLYKIGRPQKGETIFVSSAAGAVGLFVGQIAKIEGLKVIGSVGDDAKLDFIKKAGFDDGFNYKKEKSTAEALKRLAPNGIDIYYDNVGGEQFEAALGAMKEFGRMGEKNRPFHSHYFIKYFLSPPAVADGCLTSPLRHDQPIQQTRLGTIRRQRPGEYRLQTPEDRGLRRHGPGVLSISRRTG